MAIQHFLTLLDLPATDLKTIVKRASELKINPNLVKNQSRKTLVLIFEKSSTRTRVAFEVAMNQMGGSSVFLTTDSSQLGRGEPVADTARVLSRMTDCLAIRTFEHSKLENFAEYSKVPIINALSDNYHPCQLLADVQTFSEHRGDISGKVVAWVGDGNNMCQSYINAATAFDFELRIACPDGFGPNSELISKYSNRVSLRKNPEEAVSGADLVVTDVWASMGQEQEQQSRIKEFINYQVTPELMSVAAPEALFMHCFPAHTGEEVSANLIDASHSLVWEEAENRMHSQKALIEFLLDSNV